MSAPDIIAELVSLLLDDTTVSDLTDDRVFSGELPETESVAMPRASVVVSPAGGPGRQGVEKWRRNRVDTICYGPSLGEAWTLHLAVREALETLARRSDAVISIEISSDGALARDPVKQWPTAYASYGVLSAVAT